MCVCVLGGPGEWWGVGLVLVMYLIDCGPFKIRSFMKWWLWNMEVDGRICFNMNSLLVNFSVHSNCY